MEFFEGFSKIKYYIAFIALLFIGYVWAGITGTRFTGDDNEEKETRSASLHSFYHK